MKIFISEYATTENTTGQPPQNRNASSAPSILSEIPRTASLSETLEILQRDWFDELKTSLQLLNKSSLKSTENTKKRGPY